LFGAHVGRGSGRVPFATPFAFPQRDAEVGQVRKR
jgi:hypothetical protein